MTPMADKAWKAWERTVASWLGGARRGAQFRSPNGGTNDVVHDAWSIECKLLGRPSFSDLLEACRQAEKSADHPAQCPVAFVKKKNGRNDDALVIMRAATWRQWYGN